ncbi:MAG: hypothetical protein WCS17_03380 [Prevotella sp.]
MNGKRKFVRNKNKDSTLFSVGLSFDVVPSAGIGPATFKMKPSCALPMSFRRRVGKRFLTRRYNSVPLLRSQPGGFQRSWP